MAHELDAALFDRLSDGIVVLDRDERCLFVNQAGARMVGRRVEELVGTSFWGAFPGAVGSAVEERCRGALERQEAVEFEELLVPVGRWFAIRAFPAPGSLTVSFHDTTERHEAERELERLLAQTRRQRRLVSVLAETNEAVFRSTTPEELFASAVRVAVEHGGFVMSWIGVLDAGSGEVDPVASAGEGTEEYLADMRITVHEGPSGGGIGGRALRSGAPRFSNDIRTDERMAPWRDAAERVGFRSSGAFPLAIGGRVAGLLSVYVSDPGYFDTEEVALVERLAANVSYGWEAIQREAALRESEVERRAGQRFRAVLADAPTAILAVDPDGRVELVNRRAKDLFRQPAGGLARTRLGGLLRSESGGAALDETVRALADDDPEAVRVLTLTGVRPDGSTFPAEVALSRIVEDGRAVLLASVLDLSERLELEEERRRHALEAEREQADRLDSLGKLAGGVAHDFNNLLGVILNYTTLLDRQVADPAARGDIERIRAAAQAGAGLTRQLLSFARRDPVDPAPIAVNEAVRSVAQMFGRTLDPRVELRLDLADEPLVSVIDRQQFEQVVLNLAINARDAMPEGGTLTIATAPGEAAPGATAPGEAAPGAAVGDGSADAGGSERAGSVVITVGDTGVGMTPEVAERVFEPFFTTKGRGQGTGLGLAAVYGIVERSRGRVRVASTPGAGTTMTVVLPRSTQDAGPVPEPSHFTPAPAGPERVVLLVEDDATLRASTERILAGAGYQVVVACDGVEALELLDARGGEIDVVLSDIVMPRLRGDELARAVAERAPSLQVLLMTGHDSGEVPRSDRLLRKPVDEVVLLAALREALER